MWRFVLEESISRLHTLIEEAESERERETLRRLLQDADGELKALEEAGKPELAARDIALKAFAEHAVNEAMERHGADFTTLQIYDEARESVIVLAQKNFHAAFLQHLSSIKPGDGSALGECLAHDTPIAIEDVNAAAAFEAHREAATEAGFQAVHSSPVRDQSGNLIAVLSTYFRTPQSFSEDDLNRMTHYAYSIGMRLQMHL